MKTIILGTAHLDHPWIPGKCSPDGKFKEAVFSRNFIKELVPVLQAYGFQVLVDYPSLIPDNVNIRRYNNAKQQQQAELGFRIKKVNAITNQYGKDNVIYVSLHVNASGDGSKWMKGRGWEVYTSPGKTKSDILATQLWNAAKIHIGKESLLRADWKDGDPDKEANFAVLTKTKCPAVLVENMFMDNQEDLQYYLMDSLGNEVLQRVIVEGILNYWLKV